MLEIELHRTLVCDNGKTYMICEGDGFYDFKLREGDWFKEINMVHRSYLEDAIKYNQTICVGRLENGNCEYALIIDVEGSMRDKMKIDMEIAKKIVEQHREAANSISESIAKMNERKKYR